MICLDNSEFMRNGDYNPTRISSQKDAASVLCTDKIQSNPENTVGVLAMAGKEGIEVLVSPTEDVGKVLAAFSRVNIGGKSDFGSAVQIAQLALKHRKNKNGGQRIVCFVGSPIIDDVNELKKIGKQLKKNNVAIDVVSMGEIEDNHDKLLELINVTNSNDNCHLITVPAGVQPSDALQSSNVMSGRGSGGGGGGGGEEAMGGGFDDYGGIDPAMDPELAMAIRVSTEEARAREEARVSLVLQHGGRLVNSCIIHSVRPRRLHQEEVRRRAPQRRVLRVPWMRRTRRRCSSALWLCLCKMRCRSPPLPPLRLPLPYKKTCTWMLVLFICCLVGM
jgi:26S proteasome regulatory subunit N10